MSPPAPPPEAEIPLRIGDVARLVGTTPRTIRYYEEIGLLPEAPARPSGRHRTYTHEEVERLRREDLRIARDATVLPLQRLSDDEASGLIDELAQDVSAGIAQAPGHRSIGRVTPPGHIRKIFRPAHSHS